MLDSKGGFIVGLDPLSVSTQRDFVKVYNVDRYRIKIIDNIAPEGLALLNNRYSADRDENDPHGIVVRSSMVDGEVFTADCCCPCRRRSE